jgi:hypothetical protein
MPQSIQKSILACLVSSLSSLCTKILNEAPYYKKNGGYFITEVVGALVGGAKFRAIGFSGGPGIESHGLHFVLVYKFLHAQTNLASDHYNGMTTGGGNWNIRREIWRWLTYGYIWWQLLLKWRSWNM